MQSRATLAAYKQPCGDHALFAGKASYAVFTEHQIFSLTPLSLTTMPDCLHFNEKEQTDKLTAQRLHFCKYCLDLILSLLFRLT